MGVLVATMFMQARIGLRNANRGGEDHASPWGWVRQLAARRQSFVVGRRCRRRHLHRPSRWERRDAPLIWSCRKEVVADTKWGHTTPSHNILYLGSLFGDGRINLIALSSMPNGSLVRRCAAPTMTTFLSTQGQQELMTLLMPPPCTGLMQVRSLMGRT